MLRTDRSKTPFFEVKVIELSPQKILEIEYDNYAKTFIMENFRHSHRMLDRIYVYDQKEEKSEVETIQIKEGREYILKIGRNTYKKIYDINWWAQPTKFALDMKSSSLSSSKVHIEFVKFPHLYMEFLRVTLPLPMPPPFTPGMISELVANCAKQVGYLNMASAAMFAIDDTSLSDKPITVLIPIFDFHFKESHFKMYAMKPYLEPIILEELYHLTKKYLKLNEPIKCDC